MHYSIAHKQRFRLYCLALLDNRIDRAKLLIREAQESANSEEKSSAGDKYETGRAMGHLQKEMLAGQLAALIAEKKTVEQVNCELHCTQAGPGALVVTSGGTFFVFAGLGRQEMEGSDILVISSSAPLAKLMMGKKVGDEFVFKGQRVLVQEIT